MNSWDNRNLNDEYMYVMYILNTQDKEMRNITIFRKKEEKTKRIS